MHVSFELSRHLPREAQQIVPTAVQKSVPETFKYLFDIMFLL